MGEQTWQDKAHRHIADLCYSAWLAANTDKRGKRYRTHHLYHPPETAKALVDCLDRDDEEAAKSIFVHGLQGRFDE